MKTKTVIALCTLAFLSGDAGAVIRSRSLSRSKFNQMKKENTILRMDYRALLNALEDIVDGKDPIEAFEQFAETAAFNELIEDSF
jgi:ribonuclease HI